MESFRKSNALHLLSTSLGQTDALLLLVNDDDDDDYNNNKNTVFMREPTSPKCYIVRPCLL